MKEQPEEQILKDCIKTASYKVEITNNANTRMVLDALIEKQIREENREMMIKGIEQRPCVICKHKMSELKSEPCHSCTKTGDFSSPGFEEIGVKEEINKIQFHGNFDEIEKFVGGDAEFRNGKLLVATREGPLWASHGDWILKGADGKFRTVKGG